MTDNLTKRKRSVMMAKIRSKDTAPELLVRKALSKIGMRFSLHSKSILGQPDIRILGRRTVIFVHGCFWHQHVNCPRCSMPKSRIEYWKKKLEGNIKRFKAVSRTLRKENWSVITIWECQTKNQLALEALLKRRLALK